MSQRDLAGPLGLSAHSAVADYEAGRRIPPNDILIAYERHFAIAPGELQALRGKALVERARAAARELLAASAAGDTAPGSTGRRPAAPDSTDQDRQPATARRWCSRRWCTRRMLVAAGALALVACLLGLRMLLLAIRHPPGRCRLAVDAGGRVHRLTDRTSPCPGPVRPGPVRPGPAGPGAPRRSPFVRRLFAVCSPQPVAGRAGG